MWHLRVFWQSQNHPRQWKANESQLNSLFLSRADTPIVFTFWVGDCFWIKPENLLSECCSVRTHILIFELLVISYRWVMAHASWPRKGRGPCLRHVSHEPGTDHSRTNNNLVRKDSHQIGYTSTNKQANKQTTNKQTNNIQCDSRRSCKGWLWCLFHHDSHKMQLNFKARPALAGWHVKIGTTPLSQPQS